MVSRGRSRIDTRTEKTGNVCSTDDPERLQKSLSSDLCAICPSWVCCYSEVRHDSMILLELYLLQKGRSGFHSQEREGFLNTYPSDESTYMEECRPGFHSFL